MVSERGFKETPRYWEASLCETDSHRNVKIGCGVKQNQRGARVLNYTLYVYNGGIMEDNRYLISGNVLFGVAKDTKIGVLVIPQKKHIAFFANGDIYKGIDVSLPEEEDAEEGGKKGHLIYFPMFLLYNNQTLLAVSTLSSWKKNVLEYMNDILKREK